MILFWSILFPLAAQNTFNVKTLGANGNKNQLATTIIQKAIDECAAAGGGVVYFPPGDYLTGAITLRSNVTLHLEAGATIFASLEMKDFEVPDKENRHRHPVLIYADSAENISITGKGTIHGQARRVYLPLESVDGFIKEETEIARQSGIEMKQYYKIEPHTFLVFLVNCKKVTITDVTLYESCNWTLHLQWCKNVKIRGINIYSDLEKGVNADGIDIDGCQDVMVSDCHIETGDDAIVLKSTLSKGKSQPCENVTVTNCVLISTSTALKIGTETHSDFRHILFDNCVIRNSNRGLSIVVRDGAHVSDVKFSKISLELNRKHFNWWGNADGIWLVVLKRTETSRVGNISNITFDNISGDVQGTSRIEGFQGMPLKNIRLNNVHFRMNAETKADKRANDGFRAHDVDGLFLTNCSVEWNKKTTEPKWASAFVFEDISGLYLNNIYGKQSSLLTHPA
ncbi:MAG: hypothetical protein HC905_20760, partial [Bacteroidales bacterium]|nr:hypothetical protein [Bacteroidales bacterium]